MRPSSPPSTACGWEPTSRSARSTTSWASASATTPTCGASSSGRASPATRCARTSSPCPAGPNPPPPATPSPLSPPARRPPPYVVNIGPQHPSTHGVFRLKVTLDGERIIDAEMVLGYLHRSMEKLAEERTFTQNIPFTDRMDYLAAMTGNLAYCLAAEKLAGIEVPERAHYLRVIFAELQRFASHAMANGTFVNDCGAWQTPVMWMFRDREKVLDLFEMTCGARLTTNYMRIGGVAFDVPEGFALPGGPNAAPPAPPRSPPGRRRDGGCASSSWRGGGSRPARTRPTF